MSTTTTESGSIAAPPRTLTASKIAALIVANLTPLSVVVGTLPLALLLGGPSMALMFLIAGAIVGVFCIGYAQMTKKILRPGAFFNYITRGLGRTAGVAAAMIAVASFITGQTGAFAVQAAVTSEVFGTVGLVVPWQVCLVAQIILVTVLALRKIDLSSRVTMIIVAIEVLLLAWLVISAVAQDGAGVLPLHALAPSILGEGHWSVAFVFAILCFASFEAGALYSPEAKDPARSVPRGLAAALLVLTVSFAVAAWVLYGITLVDPAMAEALQQDPAAFIFIVAEAYLGTAGMWVLSVAAVLAQVACALASTSFVCRYLQSLAAEGLLPRVLERTNGSHSPSGAIWFMAVFQAVVIIGLALVGVDPFLQVAPIGFGLAALGATLAQLLCSISVIAYFRKLGETKGHVLSRVVAPSVAIVLLAAAMCVELTSFNYITGSDAAYMAYVPLIIPAIAVIGLCFGIYLKTRRPDVYDNLAVGDTVEAAEEARDRRRQATAAIKLPPRR